MLTYSPRTQPGTVTGGQFLIFCLFSFPLSLINFPLAMIGMPIWIGLLFYTFLVWILGPETIPSPDARLMYQSKV